MADSGMGTIIKVALVGGAAYLVYEMFFAAPSAVTTSTTGATTAGGGSAPVTPPPPTAAYNNLANLFSRISAAASTAGLKASDTQSPDQWNIYYNQAGGPQPAPDPISVFGNRDPMTLAQYWAGMSQWLATNKGLTGLAGFAALGRLAYARRR